MIDFCILFMHSFVNRTHVESTYVIKGSGIPPGDFIRATVWNVDAGQHGTHVKEKIGSAYITNIRFVGNITDRCLMTMEKKKKKAICVVF